MTTASLLIRLAHNARRRAHIAAAEGDRARYWREMAGAQYLLGWWDSAADYDNLGGTSS